MNSPLLSSTLRIQGLIKFALFLTLLSSYLGVASLLHLVFFLPPFHQIRTQSILRLIQLYARLSLQLLQIRTHFVQSPPLSSPQEMSQCFVICNHLSYLDVLILFANFPARFVTSQEIRQTPGLGLITQLAGCFFVERRKDRRTPTQLLAEIAEMKSALQNQQSIVLFPEGTSTSGQDVLPFKSTFFQVAIDLNLPVSPLVINYTHIDSKPFTAQNADLVCWYGEMDFLPHLFKLCQLRQIKVTLSALASIAPETHSRAEVATCAHQVIRQHYQSVLTQIQSTPLQQVKYEENLYSSQESLADH